MLLCKLSGIVVHTLFHKLLHRLFRTWSHISDHIQLCIAPRRQCYIAVHRLGCISSHIQFCIVPRILSRTGPCMQSHIVAHIWYHTLVRRMLNKLAHKWSGSLGPSGSCS